jgi:hypothetical protein
MPKRQVFFSFHYQNDVFRVHQVRNIGILEGNKSISINDWETIKKGGEFSIKKWIDENMNYRSCLVVLIGSDTSKRPWVKYEIQKAWNDGKAVLGIYIQNLRDPRSSNVAPLFGKSLKGQNPFDQFVIKNTDKKLSTIVKCYEPNPKDAYNDIATNIDNWIEQAIKDRQ